MKGQIYHNNQTASFPSSKTQNPMLLTIFYLLFPSAIQNQQNNISKPKSFLILLKNNTKRFPAFFSLRKKPTTTKNKQSSNNKIKPTEKHTQIQPNTRKFGEQTLTLPGSGGRHSEIPDANQRFHGGGTEFRKESAPIWSQITDRRMLARNLARLGLSSGGGSRGWGRLPQIWARQR